VPFVMATGVRGGSFYMNADWMLKMSVLWDPRFLLHSCYLSKPNKRKEREKERKRDRKELVRERERETERQKEREWKCAKNS